MFNKRILLNLVFSNNLIKNMKNKKTTIGAAAFTTVIVTMGFAASSFAYQGDSTKQGPNYTSERHDAISHAFETKDYDAWVTARENVSKGRIMDIINKDNFSKFAEMRELRLAGDIEGANAIRAELGLGQGNRNFSKEGKKFIN